MCCRDAVPGFNLVTKTAEFKILKLVIEICCSGYMQSLFVVEQVILKLFFLVVLS